MHRDQHIRLLVSRVDALAHSNDAQPCELELLEQLHRSEIESGRLREVSLGYDCLYTPLDAGGYAQSEITINHAAIVQSGRAGTNVRIEDSSEEIMNNRDIMERLDKMVDILTQAIRAKPTKARTVRDDSGTPPLGQRNAFYDEYSRRYDAAQNYSADCKAAGEAAGQKLLAPFRSKVCVVDRAPLRQHMDPEAASKDWADSVNEVGRRMRS